MSRRPSFHNPFARSPQWGTNDRSGWAGGAFNPSPLDPGPSRSPSQSVLLSLGTSAERYSDVSVQADPAEQEEAVSRNRKGSLARLKDAGRVLRNPPDLRKLVRRWGSKRGAEDSPRRTAPQRPPRPESLDSEVLKFMDSEILQTMASEVLEMERGDMFQDVASGSGTSTTSSDAVFLSKLRYPRNGVAVPGVAGMYRIGGAHGPPPMRPPVEDYWSVVQRNKIRLPPSSVARWVTGGVLGTGGYGRVYLVYNTTTQEQCAMKVVNFGKTISRSCCRGLINELRVLHLLGQDQSAMPFLLRPYLSDARWAWRSEAKYLHILTDAHSGGDLERYRWKLPEDSLALVCAELILGLNHLHRNRIVHHDLKPCNVLVTAEGHCVLADFGGARFMDADGKLERDCETTMIVTAEYAAPELLEPLEDGGFREYDQRVDYWSLAASVVSLVLGDAYLPGSLAPDFMIFKVTQVRTQMVKLQAPLELQEFVMDLLQHEASLRPVYPAIRGHSFFRELDWDDVLAQQDRAIPFVEEVITEGHGGSYGVLNVHKPGDSTADFVEELRKHNLRLDVDNSYDVDRHHAHLAAAL